MADRPRLETLCLKKTAPYSPKNLFPNPAQNYRKTNQRQKLIKEKKAQERVQLQEVQMPQTLLPMFPERQRVLSLLQLLQLLQQRPAPGDQIADHQGDHRKKQVRFHLEIQKAERPGENPALPGVQLLEDGVHQKLLRVLLDGNGVLEALQVQQLQKRQH